MRYCSPLKAPLFGDVVDDVAFRRRVRVAVGRVDLEAGRDEIAVAEHPFAAVPGIADAAPGGVAGDRGLLQVGGMDLPEKWEVERYGARKCPEIRFDHHDFNEEREKREK